MLNASKENNQTKYKVDRIYAFLKDYYKKANTINNMYTQNRSRIDAKIRRIILTNKRATFNLEKVKNAITNLKK